MAGQHHDLVIFQKYSRLPAQLSEFLHAKGFSSQNVSKATEIYHVSETLKDPILLIDAGNNKHSSQKVAEELCNTPGIQRMPLVVVGNFASLGERLLAEKFNQVVSVDAPCNNIRIAEALAYLVETVETQRVHHEPSAAERADGSRSSPFSHALNSRDLYTKFSTIPDMFFSELQDSGLQHVKMGGDQYLTGIVNEAYLKSRNQFPQNPDAQRNVQAVLSNCDNWSRLHLCRVAYITAQILETLSVKPQLFEHGMTAAFLFAEHLARHKPSLLRTNYLRAGRAITRKDMCSRIKDSAMKCAADFKSPEVGQVIAMIGRLIGEEDIAMDDEVSIIASSVMAADITDRFCFKSGAWDPRAANALMKKIKGGALNEIHPHVLCCLLKFLSEAALAKPWTFLLPKDIRENAALAEQARRTRDAVVARDEVKIPLTELTPGMRLSQPLLAYDGRKILSEALILDQDLIWRLWQLAAVRPLNAPAVVANQDDEDFDA
ncbi:MAG: hypothetical protein K1X83_00555 [Oligoflexia bacterium]|nr:hypothetical protein [Oligoflexia bacterium]